MIITKKDIFIKNSSEDEVPEGLIGIYEGKISSVGLPTKTVTYDIIDEEALSEQVSLVFLGVRVEDTVYPTLKQAEIVLGKKVRNYENVFEEKTVMIPDYSISKNVDKEVVDATLDGFNLSLPRLSYGKVEKEGQITEIAYYHQVPESLVSGTSPEEGRFIRTVDTGNTFYSDGENWFINIGTNPFSVTGNVNLEGEDNSCYVLGDGQSLSVEGVSPNLIYQLGRGDCVGRTNTNGDTFQVVGGIVLDSFGVTLTNETYTIDSEDFWIKIKGDFTIQKGTLEDFMVFEINLHSDIISI